MVVNIQEVNDPRVREKIIEHDELGGVLGIFVYSISANYEGKVPEEYEAHMMVARQTMAKIIYNWNLHINKVAPKGQRENFPSLPVIDYKMLDESGTKIDLETFLGPCFDVEKLKPIVRGELGNETLNSYFYYDGEETPADILYMHTRPDDGVHGAFIYALIEPPYSMKFDRSILKKGEYVLDFINFFFDDLHQLEIYAWSTDCSNFFDSGKEWWGTYFWTVYNPVKRWYVGIVGSSTD
ncbi:hypothetical protein [Chitinophaga silvisoli]|uniref:Uncharacterized protein n=1 Tax=Chitinophaga silvisoli TaxID=2291814 RepID=A0A3E1NZT6_9BACT|nr:hypothetical protein [Chitinophaga silvisoli]RFM33432.1 hypothetical protein DXN04_15840 [Chitinophaga silvisoli]